jgi:hypothetical protein
LVVFPWDKRVYQNGQWQVHPELAGALELQRPSQEEKQIGAIL